MKPYYEDGQITIYYGDCREILPTLGPVDLVLTDPPYGIGALMHGGKDTGHWGLLSQGNPWDMEKPALDLILGMSAVLIIWGGNYFDLPPCRGTLAWRKSNALPTQADFEMAWTTLDMPAKMFTNRVNWHHAHPTEKPVALMRWCIEFVPDATSILDPFMGSGTTLRAAKDLGRRAIGIEIEERYCEIAAKRLSQGVLL